MEGSRSNRKRTVARKNAQKNASPLLLRRGGIAARVIEVAHVAAARAVRVTKRATNLETENAKILIMAPEALGLRITDLKLVTS